MVVEGPFVQLPEVVAQRLAVSAAGEPAGEGRQGVVEAAVEQGDGDAARVAARGHRRVERLACVGGREVQAEQLELHRVALEVVAHQPAVEDPAVAAGHRRGDRAQRVVRLALIVFDGKPPQQAVRRVADQHQFVVPIEPVAAAPAGGPESLVVDGFRTAETLP